MNLARGTSKFYKNQRSPQTTRVALGRRFFPEKAFANDQLLATASYNSLGRLHQRSESGDIVKPRSFFLTLAAGAMALLILAGSSLYKILQLSPLSLLQGGVRGEPQAAVFVPKQAPVMVSLQANPDRLESLARSIAAPENRRQTHQEIRDIENNLLARTGLDYATEIRPWLGEEITLAVTSLDFDRIKENGAQPGYLLAVNSKDSDRAKEFLLAAYSKKAIADSVELLFESYKGINLIAQRYLQPIPQSNLTASAVVGDFVLFANDIKVLKAAINQLQVPALTLKFAENYQDALKTIVDPRVGLVYVNFPALSAWISQLPLPELPEITQTLTVALALKEKGLVAQTALIGVSGADQLPILDAPVGSVAFIPKNSLFAALGSDLSQLWANITQNLPADSPIQQLLTQAVAQIEQPLGLSLPEDIFSWVKGEFSLALVPDTDRSQWLFVAEKSANTDYQIKVQHLDDLAQAQGYNVTPIPLEDYSITAWTRLQTQTRSGKGAVAQIQTHVSGVHTETERYVLFASSLDALSQGLKTKAEMIPPNETWQKAIAALPPANDGYVYLDWQAVAPILARNYPISRVVQLPVQPLFDNLRSLVLTSQGSEQGIRRATVFFNLGVQ